MEDKYFEANKKLWDAKTPVHLRSDFYQMDSFLKGKNSLKNIELDELGDVSGKSILHLQCHFGQDTLSLARMGANCTGVDLSPKAIEEARALNEKLGLNATFVESNIYDLPQHLEGQFDIVFTSYGVIGWLPDLEKWANIINQYLKPGGTFLMAEFHPMIYCFDWDKMSVEYNYFNPGQPDHEVTQGTYADQNASVYLDEYFWAHSLQETLMPLIEQGLHISKFKEYDYSPWPCFPDVEEFESGKFRFKSFKTSMPYVFLIKAVKPENA